MLSQSFFTISLTVFAVLFLAVGILRVTEITSLALAKWKTCTLVFFHIIGCGLFSGAMGMLGIGANDNHIVGKLLFASLLILLPIHIFVGVKRRILIQDRQATQQ